MRVITEIDTVVLADAISMEGMVSFDQCGDIRGYFSPVDDVHDDALMIPYLFTDTSDLKSLISALNGGILT
jgi:hypothetical protein